MEPPEAILNSSQNILEGPEEEAEEQHEDQHMGLRFELRTQKTPCAYLSSFLISCS